ncbi:MAG: hypothetical protein GEV03_23845 [Streptosporangiales bacterium]|nr:hypothetical protein [Streptosporangiales bacterium]
MTPGTVLVKARAGPALMTVKAAHTAIWFGVEACMIYLIYAGLTRRTDRRAALAGAVVGGESLIFLVNGAHCPLTEVARSLGAPAEGTPRADGPCDEGLLAGRSGRIRDLASGQEARRSR